MAKYIKYACVGVRNGSSAKNNTPTSFYIVIFFVRRPLFYSRFGFSEENWRLGQFKERLKISLKLHTNILGRWGNEIEGEQSREFNG